MASIWFEVAVVSTLFAVGTVLFGHFEAGTPKWRRLAKLALVMALGVGISAYAGRAWFWAFLAAMLLPALYIHVWWLPRKGINGWTGEPREKYYALRGWKLPGLNERDGRLESFVILLWLPWLVAAAGGPESPHPGRRSWNGEVRVHGALRALFHDGQKGPTLSLRTLLPNANLYAVGALAELAGEVTIVGGKTYLSYPDGDTARTETPLQPSAAAALLVMAEVREWRSLTVERRIEFDQLDAEIARLADAAGMDPAGRFPFLLEGEFEDLEWHVIDGRRLAAGGSHQDHRAAAVRTRLGRASATLLGFFSAGDQGVFTHMGSRTHIHCVRDEPLATGHLDHVTIPAGTTVKVPDNSGGQVVN